MTKIVKSKYMNVTSAATDMNCCDDIDADDDYDFDSDCCTPDQYLASIGQGPTMANPNAGPPGVPGNTTVATLDNTALLQQVAAQQTQLAGMSQVILNHIQSANSTTSATVYTQPIISKSTTGSIYTSSNRVGVISNNVGMISSNPTANPSGPRGLRIADGMDYKIQLPDGSVLEVSKDGTILMNDANAKVTYRANRMREFNPFLNASDKLEEFIRFCGGVGVRQSEVLRLPLELFISWLIIEAARKDKEPEPDLPLIPNLRRRARPRCTGCGRFLSLDKRQKRLDYCAPQCFEIHYQRAVA